MRKKVFRTAQPLSEEAPTTFAAESRASQRSGGDGGDSKVPNAKVERIYHPPICFLTLGVLQVLINLFVRCSS